MKLDILFYNFYTRVSIFTRGPINYANSGILLLNKINLERKKIDVTINSIKKKLNPIFFHMKKKKNYKDKNSIRNLPIFVILKQLRGFHIQ